MKVLVSDSKFKDVEIEVDDYVWVSLSGKKYYHRKFGPAIYRIHIMDAVKRGCTPSLIYKQYLQSLLRRYEVKMYRQGKCKQSDLQKQTHGV